MKILLAPMDGLTDTYAREILTEIGGYDLCVTEFLRVTDTLYPRRVFYRRFPELDPLFIMQNQKISHTKSGIPIFLQLLGSDAIAMADNAAKAVELGAIGIDLNFGCPAKTVNRREGGASLLRYPQRIEKLVHAVRQAVPEEIPVTAKMRLGYEDQSLAHDNAFAIQEGGASWLNIHALTKKDVYRPPSYWDALAPIKQSLDIPIIANGEIWSVEDYLLCKERSSCEDIMLGRGAMVSFDLALQIKCKLENKPISKLDWISICHYLEQLYQLMDKNPHLEKKYITARLKLWTKWLMPNYHQAETIFEAIKRIKDPQLAIQLIRAFSK